MAIRAAIMAAVMVQSMATKANRVPMYKEFTNSIQEVRCIATDEHTLKVFKGYNEGNLYEVYDNLMVRETYVVEFDTHHTGNVKDDSIVSFVDLETYELRRF